MNIAKRLFGRYHQQDASNGRSSFFKSKVNRQLHFQKYNQLGPGQYQISLPLVKPQFQAIHKNNNTIIIRLNEKHSPVFQSASPRFKNPQQKSSIRDKINQSTNQMNSLRMQRNKSENKSTQIQKTNHEKQGSQIQTMKQISKKYKKKQEQKKITIRKQDMIHSKSRYLQNYLQNQNPKLQIQKQLQTIQTYQRQKQIKFQSIIKHSRGSQWSKYKQERSIIWEVKDDNPGPGSYRLKPRKIKKQHIDSWQFRSITERKPFESNLKSSQYLQPLISKTIQVTWGHQKTQANNQKKSKKSNQCSKYSYNKQKSFKKRQKSQVDLDLSITVQRQFSKDIDNKNGLKA